MVSTCSSVSDMSFLNFRTPTDRSMCQGGICRLATRSRIDRTHGRASWKVIRDIGAIDPGWWHAWHFSWRIGATSFENVSGFGVSAAAARLPDSANTARVSTPAERPRTLSPVITGLLACPRAKLSIAYALFVTDGVRAPLPAIGGFGALELHPEQAPPMIWIQCAFRVRP